MGLECDALVLTGNFFFSPMEPVVPFPSALAQTQKLAFSVEQLEGVLDEWLLEFANQEWLQEIQDRGEGDVRVVCDLIEQKQSAIWRKHNIGE